MPGQGAKTAGAYFVTINAHGNACIFGTVDGERVRLSPIGQIARQCWIKIPGHFENTEIGPFIIMPTHIHGIIQINYEENGADMPPAESYGHGMPCPRAQLAVPLQASLENAEENKLEQFGKPVPGSLATIVRAYKSAVTKRVNEYRDTLGAIVWQRNYYEHIICSDEEYATIAAYIEGNPMNWEGRR